MPRPPLVPGSIGTASVKNTQDGILRTQEWNACDVAIYEVYIPRIPRYSWVSLHRSPFTIGNANITLPDSLLTTPLLKKGVSYDWVHA